MSCGFCTSSSKSNLRRLEGYSEAEITVKGEKKRERERVPVGAGSVISGLQRSEVFYCGNKIHNRYDVPPWI
jgi:hypothetical protein